MMAAGLVVGWKNIIVAFLLACILGAVIHSIRMKVSGEDHVLAFGPYLSMGIVIVMIWGDQICNWYFSMIGL
jgi:leader peptidase (prepilin peptidase)/N-methyltransferase